MQVTTRNGDRYSCWEDDLIAELDKHAEKYQGNRWELLYEQNGKYKNIKAVNPLSKEQTADAEAAASGNAASLEDVPRDVRIRKTAMWKAAAAVVDASGPGAGSFDSVQLAENVEELAREMDDRLVGWLTETSDAEGDM